jgi:hypothetical protein
MNDSAALALGLLNGGLPSGPPGGLAPGLRHRLDRGVTRWAEVLTWSDSVGNADGAPSIFDSLTHWECADSSFHLEDFVDVTVDTVNDAPSINEADQRLLLLHGLAFTLAFGQLVLDPERPLPVRCIVSANETNATFRFHQIRPGERWNTLDLDRYTLEKTIVVDFEPAPSPAGLRNPT